MPSGNRIQNGSGFQSPTLDQLLNILNNICINIMRINSYIPSHSQIKAPIYIFLGRKLPKRKEGWKRRQNRYHLWNRIWYVAGLFQPGSCPVEYPSELSTALFHHLEHFCMNPERIKDEWARPKRRKCLEGCKMKCHQFGIAKSNKSIWVMNERVPLNSSPFSALFFTYHFLFLRECVRGEGELSHLSPLQTLKLG